MNELHLLLQLFLAFFLFLTLLVPLVGQQLGFLDLLLSLAGELLTHFLLFLHLFLLALQVAFFLLLAAIGVVSQAGSRHGGGDILDFLHHDGGNRVVRELHHLINL